ncbi:hypothetical protein [Pseudoalteromonas sp. HM-SA03]|uniref:hypothetical protein n=1 Tax=Pseudoalteromonas sp. HM-SA03 TaxID=2029678 RepID=UPI001594FF60|nr:hypothetical protein [Pseudoalteromonas sp. HM-SA03]
MKIKLNKKKIKSLSQDAKSVPLKLTKAVAGGVVDIKEPDDRIGTGWSCLLSCFSICKN